MKRALLLALALAGCASPASREPPHYYILEAPGTPAKAATTRPLTLLVAPTTTTSFYDSPQIAYSRAPGSRAYYQLNRWTEPPSRRLQALLVERLSQSGAFRDVARTTSGVRGDLVLATRLEELYHDAAAPPGSVHIRLTATLTDPQQRALVARRSFARSVPAASYDAAGAVAAFNAATGMLLDEVVAWAAAQAGGS